MSFNLVSHISHKQTICFKCSSQVHFDFTFQASCEYNKGCATGNKGISTTNYSNGCTGRRYDSLGIELDMCNNRYWLMYTVLSRLLLYSDASHLSLLKLEELYRYTDWIFSLQLCSLFLSPQKQKSIHMLSNHNITSRIITSKQMFIISILRQLHPLSNVCVKHFSQTIGSTWMKQQIMSERVWGPWIRVYSFEGIRKSLKCIRKWKISHTSLSICFSWYCFTIMLREKEFNDVIKASRHSVI